MFGGLTPARMDSATNSSSSWCAKARLKRRSNPIVVDRLWSMPGAAQRAGDVAGVNLDAVRQLEQALEAVVELARALGRLDREVGPGRFADEQRVARSASARARRSALGR